MKILPALLLVIALFTNVYSQSSLLENLAVTGQFAYQEHEKRFFTGLLDESGLGTTQVRVGLQTKILNLGKLGLYAGLGLGYEQKTYRTGFDHCFPTPGQLCDQMLRYIDRYIVTQFYSPLKLNYNLKKSLFLQLEALPIFSVNKTVFSTNSQQFSKWDFDLFGFELIPGIEYRSDQWAFSVGYRLLNWRTIDDVFVYGDIFLSNNPGYLDQKFDTHNLFKLQVGLTYALGLAKQ